MGYLGFVKHRFLDVENRVTGWGIREQSDAFHCPDECGEGAGEIGGGSCPRIGTLQRWALCLLYHI